MKSKLDFITLLIFYFFSTFRNNSSRALHETQHNSFPHPEKMNDDREVFSRKFMLYTNKFAGIMIVADGCCERKTTKEGGELKF